jgi:tetratricopeptide (TPR) repeat protein
MDKTTAYQILQISKEASDDDIKMAYIRLVKQHPPEQDPDQFIKIRKAYENLKDPAKRAKEDLFTYNFIHDPYSLPSVTGLDWNSINSEIEQMEQQLQAYPDDPMMQDQIIEMLKQRAAFHIAKKNVKDAITDWLKILNSSKNEKDIIHNVFIAYNSLAYGLAVNERHADAAHYWLESLKYSTDNHPEIIHNLAIIYDKMGNKEESAKFWKKTIDLWDAEYKKNPEDKYLKTRMIEIHSIFGKLLSSKTSQKAISEFKEALKYDPTNVNTQYQIINAYMQESKWSEAIKEIIVAIKNNRDNTELLNLLGRAYLNSGKIDEAFSVWNRILSLDPKNQVARNNIIEGHRMVGKKLKERGLYNAALVHFKSLLKYMPDNTDVHMEIGNTYALKGDHRSALASWQTVLSLDPKHKEAKKAVTETRFR